ncbi:hypothetical protein D3C84_898840 [compost metagenome]
MPCTALVGQEASMRPTRDERARRPFLPVEQLVLVAHWVAEAHHLPNPTQLTEGGIATRELDACGF